MQNIKVDVKVTLASGASVGLTEGQVKQITSYTAGLLFGQPEEVKRTYTRLAKKRRWTPEEDAILKPLTLTTDSKESRKLYKQVKRQLKRSSSTIYTRVGILRKQSKSIPVNWL